MPYGLPPLSQAEMAARPDLALVNKAASEAVNLFPENVPVRENYNEFATLFSRAVVRMQSSSQSTEAILANLQKETAAAIPLP